MDWFNYIGLIVVIVMILPNIIYFFKHRIPKDKNIPKYMVILENIGRYGSMLFLIFNIPYTWFPYLIEMHIPMYAVIVAFLTFLYVVMFIMLWNQNGFAKALMLSILPSLIFLFSGVMMLSIPLIIASIIFAISHIYISVKNVNEEID